MTNKSEIIISSLERKVFGKIDLPLFSRMRIYDPNNKPKGISYFIRKIGITLDDIFHGYLGIPSKGRVSVNLKHGKEEIVPFNARQSAYMAFASRHIFGGYENAESLFLEYAIAKSNVFYDIGSNWGYFTILAATHPKFEGEIYSFDISSEMNADLTRNLNLLSIDSVKVMGHGLSDKSGFAYGVLDRAAHLSKIFETHHGTNDFKEFCVWSLDDLNLPSVDLIKVDAEGHENSIFRGGKRIITDERPLTIFASSEGTKGGKEGKSCIITGILCTSFQ